MAQKIYHWPFANEMVRQIDAFWSGHMRIPSYSAQQRAEPRHADGPTCRQQDLAFIAAFAREQGMNVKATLWDNRRDPHSPVLWEMVVLDGDPIDLEVLEDLSEGFSVPEAMRRNTHAVHQHQHIGNGGTGYQAERIYLGRK